MKRALVSTLATVAVLALVAASAMQLISAAPPDWERPLGSAVPRGQDRTIVVTATGDSGPGTLRQALLDAQSGDTITFDPTVFPPSAPVAIPLRGGLPPVTQGNLTLDASNAGVILDGSDTVQGWVSGLGIMSDGNTVRGLQVAGFSGAGIVLCAGAQRNVIGGDRSIGVGPLGQGNLTSGNNIGIGLWDDGTSLNTITGNLIGTAADGVGAPGNRGTGIYISEGASRNTIGPDNVIAYNNEEGVQVYGSRSLANTITRNSIHNNGIFGIYLNDGGNAELPAPVIFDFDLSAGTVAGNTSANCTVEVFSDSGDQGAIYEGRTSADGSGVFAFNKGAPFSGPHLTATATDAAGNTSQFSPPTSGPRRSTTLQAGNALPREALHAKKSNELVDNRVGSVGMDDGPGSSGELADLQAVMQEVVDVGLKHFRFTIVRIDGDRVDWDKPEFSFEPRHEDFVTAMAENGVAVKWLLIFRDDVLGGEGRPYHLRFRTEEEIQRFLDYVRFIIGHVKGDVRYFEIWNEPNIGDSVQWIEVEDYIDLVRRVVPVIRQEYPGAKIATAGTTYLREPESRAYLFSILRSDIMPLVDVVSWHPMYGASPEFDSEYYYEYPSIVQQIKDTAAAHGFVGEYEAGEISWWTESEPEGQDRGIWYSDVAAAKYHARGTVTHLGMDVRVTNNGVPTHHASRQVVVSVIRNLCTIMAGAEPLSLAVGLQSSATDIRSYGFSLPDGDKLIALWTDGVAVDDDPGITTTVTLSGHAGQRVTGIDVLHGFQQRIMADTVGQNLVIRNLLVKDYPIILRISPIKYVFVPIATKGYAR